MATIEEIITGVQKEYGKEAVVTFEDGIAKNIPVISTGSIKIDRALGIGGVPRGRIIEIYGPESSGKTTAVLEIIAAENLDVQMKGKNRLMLSQPMSAEEALGLALAYVQYGVDVVAIDSVSALVPEAELKGKMGASHMGLQARLMSQAMRKLAGIAKKNNVLVIFTNQIRMMIGIVFGNPETTSGGQALKFYASVRMEIRRAKKPDTGDDKEPDEVLTRIKVVKNKMAPPFRQTTTMIRFGEGFDRYGEIFDCAVEDGIIDKEKNSYFYEGEKLGGSKQKAVDYLRKHTDFSERLREYIISPQEEEEEIDENEDLANLRNELKTSRKLLKKAKSKKEKSRLKRYIKELKKRLNNAEE